MDERMHTTQWFHTTRIPNIPSANLVQIGIGGWAGKKSGMAVARERGTTVLTILHVLVAEGKFGRRAR
jgi:hypothetical protein